MRIIHFFFLFFVLVLWSSCRSDFESVETLGNLEFSKDTVFLDTVFTNRSSSTYTLKVYNRSAEDIYIPKIQLARGETSAYRLNVDGIPGKTFENVEILAKDSIYIFLETTVNLQEMDQDQFLYQDHLQFISSSHLQEIPLVTLVKEAEFLFPSQDSNGEVETIIWGKDEQGNEIRLPGFLLDEKHLNMTSSKAYVIFGYAVVPPGRSLSIGAGSRIYFHENSGIIVSKDATLNINGKYSENREKLENEVIFQGDRLESDFNEIPGQWGTIWIREKSLNNSINYTTIKNASVGLMISGELEQNNSTVQILNTQIYNSAIYGIRGIGASIVAENLVINKSGRSSVHLSGGNHIFRHSTITNYWSQGYRDFPALLIDDMIETNTNTSQVPLEKAHFLNCLIYGNERQELLITLKETGSPDIFFKNCMIRYESETNSTSPFLDFSNDLYYKDIILNDDPAFWAPLENDLRLQANSAAINKGDTSAAQAVPFDLLMIDRRENPDIGAYERLNEN